MAPLTTVVNTFGGTWFDKDWKARLDSPSGEGDEVLRRPGPRARRVRRRPARLRRVPNNMTQGKVAMWYDATSRGRFLEANELPVKGKIGYAPAPVEETNSSGWLYTWAWGIQDASRNPDKAWKFVSWASSKRVRAAGRRPDRLVQRARPPSAPRRTRNRRLRQGGRRLPGDDQEGHRGRQAQRPRRAAAAPRPASSSSASPSSPTSAPRSPRRSARPSPDASPSRRP